MMIVLVIVSFVLFVCDHASSYYLFGSRIWQFGLGSLLAFLVSSPRVCISSGPSLFTGKWRDGLCAAVLPVTVLMLVFEALFFKPNEGQAGVHIYAVLFALLAIYGAVHMPPQGQVNVVLANRFGVLTRVLTSWASSHIPCIWCIGQWLFSQDGRLALMVHSGRSLCCCYLWLLACSSIGQSRCVLLS